MRLWFLPLMVSAVCAGRIIAQPAAPVNAFQGLPVMISQGIPADSMNAASLPEGTSGRKPEIALGLSILFPGAGQMYNGQPVKGLVFAGMYTGGVALANSAKITKSHESVTAFGWMSVALIAGTYLWNMLDAAETADRLSGPGAGSAASSVRFDGLRQAGPVSSAALMRFKLDL